MSRPIIFDINKKKKLEVSKFDIEKQIQTFVENNMKDIFNIRFLQSEFAFTDSIFGNGRIDSLGIDSSNRPVVIEYKLDSSGSITSQAFFYINWLKEHRAEFEMLVLKVLGEEARKAIDWEPYAICIASDFKNYDVAAVRLMNVEIELYKYYVYGSNNEIIAFEKINNYIEKESKKAKVNGYQQQESSNNTSDDLNNTDYEYKYNRLSEDKKNLMEKITERIIELGTDVSVNNLKKYKAFKRIGNFATAVVLKDVFYFYLSIKYDFEKMKNFNNISDVYNKEHFGTGNTKIIISNEEEFESCFDFFKQAYEENQ